VVVNGSSEYHRGRCTSMSVVRSNPVLTGLWNSAMFADGRLGAVTDDAFATCRATTAVSTNGSVHGEELLDKTKPLAYGSTNPDSPFVDAVRNNAFAFPVVTTAMQAHVVVDAMYRSAANNGATVTLGG